MTFESVFLDTTTIEPKCSHYGVCGGCRMQHLPYSSQLEYKQALVEEAFKEVPLACAPIIGCEEIWEWRNKMEFTFSQNKAGDKFLGLMQRGKRGRVESLNECSIAPEWMTTLLKRTKQWWESTPLSAYFPFGNRGLLRTLTLRGSLFTQQKLAMLTLSEQEKESLEPYLESLKEVFFDLDSVTIRYQKTEKGSPTQFSTQVLVGTSKIVEKLERASGEPLFFEIDPTAFFQPNSQQAQLIYQLIAEKGVLKSNELLFDLYCGTGTIALFCAPYVSRVIGVELNVEAVQNAQKNAEINHIKNASFIADDVEKFLKTYDGPSPQAVIVDPPRVGLSKKGLQSLIEFGADRLLYLSCNPKSQARDCLLLMEGGYTPVSMQPIDQFPQTLHVENLIVFEKK